MQLLLAFANQIISDKANNDRNSEVSPQFHLRILEDVDHESGKIGNPLIDQLPPDIRNGSYFNNPIYILYYVLFYIAIWASFDLYHRLVTYVHRRVQPAWFTSKTEIVQKRWLANLVGNTHHCIILIFAFYAFSVPRCADPFPLKWFADDLCFITVDFKFVYASLFTAGFLTYDFRIQKNMNDIEEEKDNLLLFHHVFGVIAIINAIIGGYGNAGISCLALLVEVSSLFLNYRILINREDYNKPQAIIIFLLFFFTFTVFRMMMLPYGLYLCYRTFYLTFNYVSVIRKITYVIAILQFVFLICINYFWYYKILRILKKAFCSPKGMDECDEPKIAQEAVTMHQLVEETKKEEAPPAQEETDLRKRNDLVEKHQEFSGLNRVDSECV